MADQTGEVEERAGGPPPKTKKVQGLVYVDLRRCKGCGFCIEFCPPRVLAFSKGFNPQGYHFPELVNAEDCTGCNLCGLYCPDFAIFGVMRKYAPRPERAAREEGAAQ